MGVCKRALGVNPFLVMDVLEAAQRMERDGKDVIHLEIGEPDFDTPECVKEAAVRAIRDNRTHYTHSLGIPELREAICEHYQARYKVTVDPGQVMVTQGTSPAMLLLFSALLEECDEVILSDPCYACYPNFVTFAGAVPVRVPVIEEDGFQFRVSKVRQAVTDRTRALLLNSPANPTGTVLSAERTRGLADLARERGLSLFSDEIYHGLVYEGRERSILEFTDQAFVLGGFSKLWAMTGWRLGWLVAPSDFVRPLQKLAQNFFISANTPAQWAGVTAIREAGDDVERMRAIYAERRRFLLDGLRGLGFSVPVEPTGAFYVLVNCKDLAARFQGSSLKLAFDILEKARVGVTPGIDFGPGAEGYLRFSYANSVENIAEGLKRLAGYIESA